VRDPDRGALACDDVRRERAGELRVRCVMSPSMNELAVVTLSESSFCSDWSLITGTCAQPVPLAAYQPADVLIEATQASLESLQRLGA
jgi:hypothetical protein